LYKAIWLALGFGLRKSEISLAKNSWFQELNGVLYCAGDELAKNNRFPRVRAQLGAWQKLSPYIQGQDPDAFVIQGTDQERTDHLFRRCSTWMQGLGWQSQKMIHELRSYAGCQIAMGNSGDTLDLRAAQEFLRHASLTTTENFYMRYLRSILKEVKLTLPVPAPFIPQIITA
jgi:integrase